MRCHIYRLSKIPSVILLLLLRFSFIGRFRRLPPSALQRLVIVGKLCPDLARLDLDFSLALFRFRQQYYTIFIILLVLVYEVK